MFVGCASGAGDTGHRVDDDAVRLDQPRLHERTERQHRRRDVAAGGGHQRCALQLRAMQLGESVHRVRQQPELIVFEPVVRRVLGGLLQTVGRGQIDDTPDVADQLRNHRQRRLVWETEEHHVEAAGALDLERLEDEVRVDPRQAGVQLGRSRSGLRVARRVHHVEVGMLSCDAKELGAGEPGRTDDADFDHSRMTIRYLVLSYNPSSGTAIARRPAATAQWERAPRFGTHQGTAPGRHSPARRSQLRSHGRLHARASRRWQRSAS